MYIQFASQDGVILTYLHNDLNTNFYECVGPCLHLQCMLKCPSIILLAIHGGYPSYTSYTFHGLSSITMKVRMCMFCVLYGFMLSIEYNTTPAVSRLPQFFLRFTQLANQFGHPPRCLLWPHQALAPPLQIVSIHAIHRVFTSQLKG